MAAVYFGICMLQLCVRRLLRLVIRMHIYLPCFNISLSAEQPFGRGPAAHYSVLAFVVAIIALIDNEFKGIGHAAGS